MRALLLAGENDIFLAVAVFGLFIALAIILIGYLRKKLDYSQQNTRGAKFEGKVKVVLHKPFIQGESFRFYNALQRALPVEFTAFPNVGVDTIIKPVGEVEGYNTIAGKYLDFVIFKKDGMVPVAVIDLINPSTSLSGIGKQLELITKTLKAINIPVIEFLLQESYNEKEILAQFLDSQDAFTIAMLKKDRQVNKDQ